MFFPPGDIALKARRSRWREIEFMAHEICAAVLPRADLSSTLLRWSDIALQLSDSKRNRIRQMARLDADR